MNAYNSGKRRTVLERDVDLHMIKVEVKKRQRNGEFNPFSHSFFLHPLSLLFHPFSHYLLFYSLSPSSFTFCSLFIPHFNLSFHRLTLCSSIHSLFLYFYPLSLCILSLSPPHFFISFSHPALSLANPKDCKPDNCCLVTGTEVGCFSVLTLF